MSQVVLLLLLAANFCSLVAQPRPEGGPPPGGPPPFGAGRRPPPPGGRGGPGGGPGVRGDGIWVRNAYWGEWQTFDACVGHQPPDGMYHHHATPNCLRAQLGDNIEAVRSGRNGTTHREKPGPWHHSPILGWALDGYPIYGPYAYSDPNNPSSPVKRIRSGYRLRNITARTSLPDWALPVHPNVPQELSPAQYGPAINRRFPLGRYIEDSEFVAGFGDLDEHNGRFAVTPEFPQGTYAYYVTLDTEGKPAFPYLMGGQLYGTMANPRSRNVPSGLSEYFNRANGVASSTPKAAALSSWMTAGSGENAKAVTAYDPSAAPSETWPRNVPAGARYNGGVTSPTEANIQRVRYDDSDVYIDTHGLAAYTMGPWFDPGQPGGLFGNLPTARQTTFRLPRNPAEATSKQATGLGPVGFFVNGVAVFNYLDGASYSRSRGDDEGGGIVIPSAIQVSTASREQGPAAPRALVTARSIFGSTLATRTETSRDWPESLGGATVTVRDSTGAVRPAPLSYASPDEVRFQVPEDSAPGIGTVTYSAGGSTCTAGIYIAPSYPHLAVDAEGRARGQVIRFRNARKAIESIDKPIAIVAREALELVLYGSGRGKSGDVRASVGGVEARVSYGAGSGTYERFDQFTIEIPAGLQKRGPQEVLIMVDGRSSNRVPIELR